MSAGLRRTSVNLVRFAVCAAALWFVARGVTLHDVVVLAGDDARLVGHVQQQPGGVLITLTDGAERRLRVEEIAVDAQGDPQIIARRRQDPEAAPGSHG